MPTNPQSRATRLVLLAAALLFTTGCFLYHRVQHAILTSDAEARWQVKTSLPDHPGPPRFVPLAALMALPDPPGAARLDASALRRRIPPFPNKLNLAEGDLIATEGWVHFVGRAWDRDLHLPLTVTRDQTEPTLIVEVPDPRPDNVPDPELRGDCLDVVQWIDRELLNGKTGSYFGERVAPPRHVRVVGQLFYDADYADEPARGDPGMKAGTLWELHPVIHIAPLPSQADGSAPPRISSRSLH